MPSAETTLKTRVDTMRSLSMRRESGHSALKYGQAVNIGLSVLHDTVGSGHPLMGVLLHASKTNDYMQLLAAAQSVIDLYDQGALVAPRLAIAHEIEGDVLDVAESQLSAAEKETDSQQRQMRYAIAAFLVGAALEDGLRRLADSKNLEYDRARTTLSKLQNVLYQPGKGIEEISNSENKQITTWADTRNLADHGHFDQLTSTAVLTMLMGVRSFLDKHLP